MIASGNAEGSTGLPFLTCSNIGKTVNNQTPLMAFRAAVQPCEFCGFHFDHDQLGRYGCPNCEGEGLGVAHTLRGEGFDASEDGTGRGTPLVPVLPFDTTQVTSRANRSNPKPGDPCHPLAAGAHAPAIAQAVPIQECNVSRANLNGTGTGIGLDGDPMFTLQAAQPHGIAYAIQAGALRTNPDSGPDGVGVQADKAYTLEARAEVQCVGSAMQVRRLTPEECEALQGFPRGYTAIPWRKKPAAECPDGPRYKALGNSWAVPNVRWIGRRIDAVQAIRGGRVA